ncbi:MAG: bifunctional DNA-binding transcriptional regulator/O6-methylguanine-DNA methyltransferase Ada [Desulfovibrionaceae bacterium]|jgi:AraC family transcriptional regulator of adaptative response/methylated-DNA-[protein]-cysteine methyltransferase|nr:bifunctional DNA-binding transcriptional regulator/O6-methylguanine-DNA methyltransferase Ada [Desulfovibrionaceae bacterium]
MNGKSNAYATTEERLRAVIERDRDADGAFVYGVRTTRIFCRPWCPSRRPRPENVEFFATPAEALAAGYRPCRRCRPEGDGPPDARLAAVVRACRTIEAADAPPPLATLAAEAGLSPWHFQRVFREIVGVTPRQYAATHQARRFRASLDQGDSVTDAVYAAGYGSSSRAYENAGRRLAMAPTEYRAGAAGLAIRYRVARCFLGWVLVAASARGVCAIELGDGPEELERLARERFPGARLEAGDAEFAALVERVVAGIERPRCGPGPELPLDIQGTAFQERVWAALRELAPGETATYAQIAARIGSPGAARAVGRACAANRLAVAVPCHRVLRGDGSLGGYRWGEERKRKLLEREGEDVDC